MQKLRDLGDLPLDLIKKSAVCTECALHGETSCPHEKLPPQVELRVAKSIAGLLLLLDELHHAAPQSETVSAAG